MSMEKRNVVEKDRTPESELGRSDQDWDKNAADVFEVSHVDAEIIIDGKAQTPSKK